MTQRLKANELVQNALKVLYPLNAHLAKSSLGKSLLHFIYMRLSQINSCAFCLDMHSKDLRAEGETEQRIYALNAWRETPFFSEKERAALAWAEAVNNCNVPDELYEETSKHFSEEELVDLTLGITAIKYLQPPQSCFSATRWNVSGWAIRLITGNIAKLFI